MLHVIQRSGNPGPVFVLGRETLSHNGDNTKDKSECKCSVVGFYSIVGLCYDDDTSVGFRPCALLVG